MKNILLSVFLSLTAATSMEAQQMIVHLKDGKQITYTMTDVDSVEIKAQSTTNDNPYGPQLTGTAANAVDLGLSVKWADHNLGADIQSDSGTPLAFAQVPEKAALWGSDWRLPTDAEWQELYNSCTWSWTICNGIGGRQITGKNGNSIFIPASGVSFDDKIYIRGCIGIYWTADTETPPADSEIPQNAIGAYFDSANIYRISYPMTNKFTVRLVRK